MPSPLNPGTFAVGKGARILFVVVFCAGSCGSTRRDESRRRARARGATFGDFA